jgi:hypothetical protein
MKNWIAPGTHQQVECVDTPFFFFTYQAAETFLVHLTCRHCVVPKFSKGAASVADAEIQLGVQIRCAPTLQLEDQVPIW